MKLGIMTAARTNNFGTDLQAYAMQKVFGKYSDAEIIDYVCPKLENSHKLLNGVSLIGLIYLPWKIYKNISHFLFRKKYFKKSRKYTVDNVHEIKYDAVVVGSDQIWNLDITGNDMNFFLPFEGPAKYAYAASIGKEDIRHWQEKYNLKKYLDDFLKISVREASGVDVLKGIGVDADYHLDPILMLDKDEWTELATRKTLAKYVFVYLIQKNDEAIRYAKKYATENGLKVVVFQSPGKYRKGIRKCVYCDVVRWISYMNNADMIITNSYHGLSMAIALERNFRVFGIKNSVQNNSRMENLVKNTELESFMYVDKADGNYECPDWENVRQKLKCLQEKSLKYIKEITQNQQ